jgi:hypothetical protein
MRESRCNIIDRKSHSPCTNKTHWCTTSFCLRTSWKWRSSIWILFNRTHGGGCPYQGIIQRTTS